MFVLKAEGIEPILIGVLGSSSDEGIFIEIEEENVPKKYRVEKLGGCAVVNGKYIRSNTYGITSGKYFTKIAEPLDFEPKLKEKFEMLEDESIRYDLDKVIKILEETDNGYKYILGFELNEDGTFLLYVKRHLTEEEIEVQDHEYKEYKDNFIEMYSFYINIRFVSLTKDQVQEIKNGSSKRTIKVSLDELKAIINKYDLKIEIPERPWYYHFYSKNRTSFNGRHTEGIDVYSKDIDKIMTFAEATQKWGLADSTLRKLVTTNKLIEGIDYRKSGKVWLITKEAMLKVYGEPLKDSSKKKIEGVKYYHVEN